MVFPQMKNFITDGVFCPSISKIGNVKAPVFIMHGTKDEVVALFSIYICIHTYIYVYIHTKLN